MNREWDSPAGVRMLLAAALLVAAAGTVTERKRERERDVAAGISENGTTLARADRKTAMAPGFVAAGGGAETDSAPVRDEAFTDLENLHDAPASLAPTAAPAATAARSAAFMRAGGRVPGAFAPATQAGSGEGPRHGDDLGSASAAALAAARPAASADMNGDGAARFGGGVGPSAGSRRSQTSAATQSVAPGLTPAERFFSMASLAGAEAPARGAAQAGSAPLTAAGRADERKERERRGRRMRPALLSKLLGLRALRAPQGVLVPTMSPWTLPRPETGPDGKPTASRPLGFGGAEASAPPSACRRAEPHWHSDGDVRWYHDGALWGRDGAAGWAWLERDGGRTWLWPEPGNPPLLWQEQHWWLPSRGLWFLLHDGAPWGAQYLREWGQEGFVHPSGARMIYSADGRLVGMIEADAGAILYDARTGEEVGRWTPDQLPQPRKPAVPSKLPTPR